MKRWMSFGAAITAALSVAAPAVAQPSSASTVQTITATGTGQTRVLPTNRHRAASIAAAVDAARKASIGGALAEAHEYALDYAEAIGVTLGNVISVSDAQTNSLYGLGSFDGPFGPGQYCGTAIQVVGRPVKGQKPKLKKVHRCYVPQFASISLTVTYSAN
jgi:uncharacterized protein YggE